MSRGKRKSNDDSKSEAPEAKTRGSPKADLVKLKLQNTTKFDVKLLESSKYERNDVVTSMKPEDFTMDYYHKEGLKKVLLFDCDPKELNMKIPPKTFTPRDVMNQVGKNKSVKYFNVTTQTEFTTSFEDFVDYFETPVANRIYTYNVISLEVSGTGMMDLVQAPALVRQIDLASAWPDERKQREISFDVGEDQPTIFNYVNKYPRVEHFCLMSASASYTGFHIDFHGSSVWYHVVNGEKVFFIIEPKEENIRKYEEYLKRKNDFEFFGDLVDKCTRVTVKPGQTLMLPSGWIHSVYTPMDTLVFGGNFIHPLSLKMQMRIVRHENELELKKHEKYPQADEVVFHYMDDVVRRVTGRRHIRPSSRNRQKDGLQYVGDKFIALKRHRDIPDVKNFEEISRDTWRLASSTTIPDACKDIEETDDYEEMNRIFSQFDELKANIIDTDEFFIDEHPLIFYHPKTFDVESRLKHRNPCGEPLSLRFNRKMEINDKILHQCIHHSEIVEWEAYIEALLMKESVNLPEGLTRPNSLVHSFYLLLTHLRKTLSMKRRTTGVKYDLPARECSLNQRWNQRSHVLQQISKNEPCLTPVALNRAATPVKVAKREMEESPSRSAQPPVKRVKLEQENIEPTDGPHASLLNTNKTLMHTPTAGSPTVPPSTTAIPATRHPVPSADNTTPEVAVPAALPPSTPAPTVKASPPSSPIPSTPSISAKAETFARTYSTRKSLSASAAPTLAIHAQSMGMHGQPYTDEENAIILSVCREWMLGYDDRMAKIEETRISAVAAKKYASKRGEMRARNRASVPKARKPCLRNPENMDNLLKALPYRSEASISRQMQKLEKETMLREMIDQFKNGTLADTSITAPEADTVEKTPTNSSSPIRTALVLSTPIRPSVSADETDEVPSTPTNHSTFSTPACARSTPSTPSPTVSPHTATTPSTTPAHSITAFSSTTPTGAATVPTPTTSARSVGGHCQSYTDEENDIIIRLCGEWLLGYDDRMNEKTHSSNAYKSRDRDRSNTPISRRHFLLSVKNLGNIHKSLPNRTEASIMMQIQKLKKKPSLKTILNMFETGTLTVTSIETLLKATTPSTLAPTTDTPTPSTDTPNETIAATSIRYNPFGRSWSDQENDVLIRQCGKWLLGQQDRMEKLEEAIKRKELDGRARANVSKPCFANAANIAIILKKLPHRSEKSIVVQISKLKSQPALKNILEQFENGTLTSEMLPSETAVPALLPISSAGPWTEQENDVIIRICREWMLGYEERIANLSEARIYSKSWEWRRRNEPSKPPSREPGLTKSANIANLLKVLPHRSRKSISNQIDRLPILKSIVEEFKNGTLTADSIGSRAQSPLTPFDSDSVDDSTPSTPEVASQPLSCPLSRDPTGALDELATSTTPSSELQPWIRKPWSKEETEVVIRMCRDWMLGYEQRMEKIEEDYANGVHFTEYDPHDRSTILKPRKTGLCSTANLVNIQKELPNRNENSIMQHITKLKNKPILKSMIIKFEEGTLTRED